MALNETDIEAIAKQLADNLVEKRRLQWVDPETHYQHHQFVGDQITRMKNLEKLKHKILLSACIWAIPFVLIWLATSFWESILSAIRSQL